jgi:hypothetical protein
MPRTTNTFSTIISGGKVLVWRRRNQNSSEDEGFFYRMNRIYRMTVETVFLRILSILFKFALVPARLSRRGLRV